MLRPDPSDAYDYEYNMTSADWQENVESNDYELFVDEMNDRHTDNDDDNVQDLDYEYWVTNHYDDNFDLPF